MRITVSNSPNDGAGINVKRLNRGGTVLESTDTGAGQRATLDLDAGDSIVITMLDSEGKPVA